MAKSFEKWYRVKVVFFGREDFIRRSGDSKGRGANPPAWWEGSKGEQVVEPCRFREGTLRNVGGHVLS